MDLVFGSLSGVEMTFKQAKTLLHSENNEESVFAFRHFKEYFINQILGISTPLNDLDVAMTVTTI